MSVIDFRFRPNTPETLAGIGSSSMFKDLCNLIGFPKMKPQSLAEIVEDLDRHNVVKAVITGRDCEVTYGAKSNNQSVIDFVDKYPNKFIGFAGVDPHKGMNGIYDLKKMVTDFGLKGAAIDPYLAHLYANDAKYYPIYAKCCELDIPLVICTGPATLVPKAVIAHVAPQYIDFVARDFPELKIIVSHGGYPWVNEMIAITQRNKNVYLELSEYEFSPMAEAYMQAINTMIGDKVVYASAHPFEDFKIALKNYEKLPINDNVRKKVMFQNAASLLNITVPDSTQSSGEKRTEGSAVSTEEIKRIVDAVLKNYK
jgi:uncharacterized protein